MHTDNTFAEKLRYYQVKWGYKNVKMGEIIGVGERMFAYYETKERVPTEYEHLLIKKKLIDSNYNFYRLSAFIYYTQMREKEALAIKISDINFESNIITIIRERSRDNAKHNNNTH